MSAAPQSFAGRALGDLTFELGEGPTYDPATNTAWWFDILGRKLVEYPFATGEMKVHDLPMMASALAFTEDGRQVLCNEDGICLRDPRTGMLARYLDLESDKPDRRSNDGRVHPSGALWISTFSKATEPGAAKIYHVAKGKTRVIARNLTIPNSICFSPDGATGYYSDTDAKIVMRVALDPATGLPADDPVVFQEPGRFAGAPDGAIVDADGCFWSARWGNGSVDVFSPAGDRIASHAIPAKQVSCPAFVGRNADRVLVTTACEGMDAAAREADPLAGSTFLLDVAVRGRHEPRMIL